MSTEAWAIQCGASADHQRADMGCDGDISAVVEAARQEITKIVVLRNELNATVSELERESSSFGRRLPALEAELEKISGSVEGLISPRLSKLRASYAELADKRGEVREALGLFDTVQDLERRRLALERTEGERTGASASSDIPTTVTYEFAQTVKTILEDWHFPDAGDVHFDTKARDIVISGKSRSAFGKGLRAITHAAFTLGLMAFCRARQTPHSGVVVLDSPLLAYREPEGDEDDLQGTDLQEQFYAYLQTLSNDSQVIIIENSDPPDAVKGLDQVEMFGKNPHHGRYGLFPVESDPSN